MANSINVALHSFVINSSERQETKLQICIPETKAAPSTRYPGRGDFFGVRGLHPAGTDGRATTAIFVCRRRDDDVADAYVSWKFGDNESNLSGIPTTEMPSGKCLCRRITGKRRLLLGSPGIDHYNAIKRLMSLCRDAFEFHELGEEAGE
ncbi:hypothetical protein GWI33_008371 [Rhynchophorus ferrugineus]|uniref:Uncharacterized protein n=1 Tax=Rhynchophorus ferrugineus TaxID=354439 RepID=A0A834IG78_RHYFE|nr:hypothetical protein GWI33_008371 [Rhynchophorus ferrugineus]